MTKRKAIMGGVVLILLVGCAWAFGFFRHTDPAVARLQELADQMSDKNLTDAQRKDLRGDFRTQMGSLNDDQRRAFFDANRDDWNRRMQERMDEYFKMSKADQQKRLDDILNRIVQNQKAQQNTNGQADQNGRNNRGNRGMTEAQREERSKRRLDRSTPILRAQMSEFRKQLSDRAQQRGISLGDPGRGFGRGFGGGA